MAAGDEGAKAGFEIVPDTGENGRVRWGGREINKTRDYIARVKALVPTSKGAFRTSSGISSGTSNPSGGADGDIYFKVL